MGLCAPSGDLETQLGSFPWLIYESAVRVKGASEVVAQSGVGGVRRVTRSGIATLEETR